MQGESDSALDVASKLMSSAMACAGRRIGPCTTSIRLKSQSLRRSLIHLQDQPTALTSPSILPNVAHLELRLHSLGREDDDGLREFVSGTLRRLPNLVATKLYLTGHSCVFALMPLLRLRHLDLTLDDYGGLDHVPLEHSCRCSKLPASQVRFG